MILEASICFLYCFKICSIHVFFGIMVAPAAYIGPLVSSLTVCVVAKNSAGVLIIDVIHCFAHSSLIALIPTAAFAFTFSGSFYSYRPSMTDDWYSMLYCPFDCSL